MIRAEIEYILKRIPQIKAAIKNKQTVACFYLGKRREVIPITEEVLTILQIIDEVLERIDDVYAVSIIHFSIEKGKSDAYTMKDLPMSYMTYIKSKQKIRQRIYVCCVSKGLVSYEEIFKEKII